MVRLRVPALALAPVLLAPAAGAQDWLSIPRALLYGTGLEIRGVGDFDGAGRPDLLVVQGDDPDHSLGGIVSFQAYVSTGEFDYAPGPVVDPTVFGGYPGRGWIEVGDVTGDGLDDVILGLAEYDGGVGHGMLLYVSTGGGTFAAPQHIAGTGVPMAASLGDPDFDGVLELAAVWLGLDPVPDQVGWWDWNGTTLVPRPTGVTVPLTPNASVGDFDVDGRDDVVLGSDWDDIVRIYTTDALGGLSLYRTIELDTGNAYGFHALAGDLDADGDSDLVCHWESTATTPDAVVVQRLRNDGGGVFTPLPQQQYLMPAGPYAGAGYLTDWDADGDADLVVAYSRATYYENRGNDEGFAFPVVTPITSMGSGSFGDPGSHGAPPADLDADGRMDFAADEVVHYGDGTFRSAARWVDAGSTAAVAFDVDHDGDLDVLEPYGDLSTQDGDGGFAERVEYTPFIAPPARLEEGTATGDFDGDGFADVYVVQTHLESGPTPFSGTLVFDGMRLLVGTPQGDFALGPLSPTAGEVGNVATFELPQLDVDGDGDRDVIAVDGWWENDGAGVLTAFHPEFDGLPRDVADMENDGDLDALVYDADAPAYVLVKNIGKANVTSTVLSTELLETPFTPDLFFLDLDDDGDQDVVAGFDGATSGARVWLSLAGSLQAPFDLPTIGRAHEGFFAEDVDGDGLRDLVGANATAQYWQSGTWAVWRRTGPGLTYAPPVAFLGPAAGLAADLDSDGDLDGAASYFVRTRRWDGPTAGGVRQFAFGMPGTDAWAPLLGARGPLRPGEAASLHVSRALGGAPGVLWFGTGEGLIPDFPLQGLVYWLDTVLYVTPILAGGVPGQPGGGLAEFPFTVGPNASGKTVTLQAYFLDLGAIPLFSGTNGLELRYGG